MLDHAWLGVGLLQFRQRRQQTIAPWQDCAAEPPVPAENIPLAHAVKRVRISSLVSPSELKSQDTHRIQGLSSEAEVGALPSQAF
jgi:hypothetical protein